MRRAVLNTILLRKPNRLLHVSFPNHFIHSPVSHYLQSSKWLSFISPIPPPEWVQPFDDLSDLIRDGLKTDLKPSPRVLITATVLQNAANIEQELNVFCKKYLVKLPPNFVAYILKKPEHFLANGADIGFRFFTWAGKQKGYAHNLECYVYMIEHLCLESDFDRVKLVFNEFKCKDFLMNSSAANSLIRSFGNGGLVQEVEPSLFTYNFLMNGLVNSMFVESAERIFEVMETGIVKPDVVTYNTMIKGYC